MAILVVADHSNDSLSDSTSKTVTAATKMGGDIDILVAGENAGPAAEAAAKISGVRKVLHADNAAYAKQLAEPMAELIAKAAEGYDAILAPAGTSGRNFMPRVAAKLDVMQ